ncbi:RING-H2 finger protein ATL78, partial [Cucurbita argyrosperma subsp. argyrosperma]
MSISITRRFLLPTATATATATAVATPSSPPQPRPGFGSFDLNVVMVLSVLLCALVCSLGLNAILKCALRCSTLLASASARHGGNIAIHPKGVGRNTLKKFPTVEYSKQSNKFRGIAMDGECVICLADFEPGDRVRILPKCYHGFHVHCIDKWLSSHTSCPKCRNCLSDTSRKVDAGCGSAVEGSSSSVGPPPPSEEVVVNVGIAPVEREGLTCSYRDSSR